MNLIYSAASDEVLWNAIKNGDETAFKLVFNRYLPTLLATARHYIKDENTCENLVQDIFLNIWFKKACLDIRDFRSYFTASVRYGVYRELKAKSNLFYTDEPLENSRLHQTNEAEDNFNVLELKNQIDTCLQALPKRCREIFVLSRQEQLSNSEIASRLNISKRSVENQITTALQHLRIKMSGYSSINTSIVISVILALAGD